jgi:prolycopene isomerase
MGDERFDAVVIGAGLGGLSTAGYLARAGKRVLVLEHHSIPGGYAHEFKRRGFRFEVSLHAIDGVQPGGWAYPVLRDLDVFSRVEFHSLDPFYTVRFPEHEVVVHADPFAYESELVRHFPDEAAGIRSLIDGMIRVFSETRRFWEDGKMGTRPVLEQMPGRYPHMLEAMNQSWADFMDRHLDDPQAKAVISTLWGYYGLPPSSLNAATFILPWVSYHFFGAFYPSGGSMAISRALEEDVTSHGGEIRYRQTVNDIELDGGLAVAVTTEKGLRVETDVVISNASAPETLLQLVGEANLPAAYVKDVEDARPSLSNLVVYLGLDCDLAAQGWDHHEYYVSNTYDLEADYRDAQSGHFDETAMVLTHYTHVDPDAAPDGHSVLSLFALAPWDHADVWGTDGDLDDYSNNPGYLRAKEQAADELIDRAERLVPGLRDMIVIKEIGTPLTNRRYSRNPSGEIYGSEQSVENMYVSRLDRRTPIANLFLAGAWTFGGGQSAALLSGRATAATVLAHLDGTADPDPRLIDDDAPHEQVTTTPEVVSEGSESVTATLTAVESGRSVSLGRVGLPSVFVFHGQDSAGTARSVVESVRSHYPHADEVMVANIVDLRGVPRMFRKVANRAMRSSFKDAAAALPDSLDPAEFVVILPDWNGAVTMQMEFDDVNQVPGIAVFDASGVLVGTQQGPDPAEAALTLLESALRGS